LFLPNTKIQPTSSSGVISKVVTLLDETSHSNSATNNKIKESRPVILQTSAVVHRGNSGGLLLNKHGQLVGMVTSNVKLRTIPTAEHSSNDNNNKTHPSSSSPGHVISHLNFSIPAVELAPIIDYIRTGDMSSLRMLHDRAQSEHTRMKAALWKLQDISIKPSQPANELDEPPKGKKLSEFLKQQQSVPPQAVTPVAKL